ncbi:finger protein [Dactylonectria estremocensis]|uniref:Finger protein n=1 Tax=Dactylonectria estremocensis TaxID=1079267 RepID=A0A9P9DPD3_9HYPO|nr:finger protein [Dactylonectria estremocensis]
MDESSAAALAPSRRSSGGGRSLKRPREDPVRLRVSRACDRCKARKSRCSGTWPCVFCSHLKLDCQFTAVHRRGQLLPAIDNDSENVPQNSLPVNRTSERGISSNTSGSRDSFVNVTSSRLTPTIDTELVLTSPTPTVVETRTDESPSRHARRKVQTRGQPAPHSMRNSPEPSQTDQQGHYVGPASGVSFLLRIQRKLQVQSPGYLNSSVFNFGDRPLPGHDSSFAILPPKPLAESMVKRYFDFAATTHRFLHRPSIEAWLEELYETNGAMLYQESARSRTALLFMVFAHSNNYRSRSATDTKDRSAESAETGARFFAVAEHQLSMEKGQIQLANVQARLAQCFYLLAQSRLNHCWTLFGITAHLALALGIHRKSRIDVETSNRVDHVELECRKRTFWCAYNLNTYLSAALGRPMTFHDEYIDQELPLCVDDEQLRRSPTPQPAVLGPSITSATVAQIKLSRILASILRTLYGIHPRSTEEHFTLAARFTRDLSEWREHISYLLDTDGSSAMFVKLVLRQRDVLKLAFWHAQILIHRPFLLKSFTSLANYGVNGDLLSSRPQEMKRNIQICIDAATQITEHIDHIDAAGEFYSTLFFIPYYGFSAVVILYVYAIQQRDELPETYTRYFRLASKCHAQLESIAIKGSLMQRYGVVLQELRLEVLRNNTYLASVSTPRAGGSAEDVGDEEPTELPSRAEMNERSLGQQNNDGALGVNDNGVEELVNGEVDCPGGGYQQGGDMIANTTAGPMDLIDGGFAHMASWGQFDSLVTGGTGTLDLLPQSDVWGSINATGFNTW